MAVTYVGTPTSVTDADAGSSLTWSHTNPANGDYILVAIGTGQSGGGGDTTAVTFNGDALTAITNSTATDSNWTRIEGWFRIAPDVATGNVVATVTFGDQAIGIATSANGVHQTVSLGTAVSGGGTTTTASVSVTDNASGDSVFGAVMSDSEGGITPTGTEILESAVVESDTLAAMQHYPGTGSGVTVQWNQVGTGWSVFGVAVKPADAAAAAPVRRKRLLTMGVG